MGKSETAPLGGILAGVAEDIAEGAIEEAFVALDKAGLVVEADFDGEVIAAELEVECFEEVAEDADSGHGAEDKLEASGLDLAGGEEVVEEGEDFDAVGVDGLDEFACAGMGLASFAIEDKAAVSENGGERDFDIVGDHGDHVVAEAVRVEAGKCPFHSGPEDLELEWFADVVKGVVVEGLDGAFRGCVAGDDDDGHGGTVSHGGDDVVATAVGHAQVGDNYGELGGGSKGDALGHGMDNGDLVSVLAEEFFEALGHAFLIIDDEDSAADAAGVGEFTGCG
jgi:hypothetical protein